MCTFDKTIGGFRQTVALSFSLSLSFSLLLAWYSVTGVVYIFEPFGTPVASVDGRLNPGGRGPVTIRIEN